MSLFALSWFGSRQEKPVKSGGGIGRLHLIQFPVSGAPSAPVSRFSNSTTQPITQPKEPTMMKPKNLNNPLNIESDADRQWRARIKVFEDAVVEAEQRMAAADCPTMQTYLYREMVEKKVALRKALLRKY